MSIIDTIDNAVQDWATSGDAMRWSSEPVPVSPDLEVLGRELSRFLAKWGSRPERTSRMRRAYRVKRGGRW